MIQKLLNCLIRRIPVTSTPEEIVRQSLLRYMIEDLKYPLENIAVEKNLNQIPYISLEDSKVPQRRADIICFAKDIHPNHSLYPLLLIECKSVDFDSKVKNQVIGYNRFVKAFYISIANQKEIQTGWFNRSTSEYQFIDGLPSFRQLVSGIKD